jgi:hypothetical protein
MDKNKEKYDNLVVELKGSKLMTQLNAICELIVYISNYDVRGWIQQCEHSCRRNRFLLIPEVHPEVIHHT